jgi:hypothetical protein
LFGGSAGVRSGKGDKPEGQFTVTGDWPVAVKVAEAVLAPEVVYEME